jgi:hypothetical protein
MFTACAKIRESPTAMAPMGPDFSANYQIITAKMFGV